MVGGRVRLGGRFPQRRQTATFGERDLGLPMGMVMFAFSAFPSVNFVMPDEGKKGNEGDDTK